MSVRFLFPSRCRLHTQAEWQLVFKQGRFVSLLPGLKFWVCSTELGFSRIGVVVSKRAFSKATDRHRIKRVIREWFRLKVLPQSVSFDMVVRVDRFLEVPSLRMALEKYSDLLNP